MSTYTVYVHTISGDSALLVTSLPSPTNRVFTGWYGDASEGEAYQSEWSCYAVDGDDALYEIVWIFPAVKGAEPEDDGWPWEDESFIHHIKPI